MITPNEIKDKALKQYPNYLRDYVSGRDFDIIVIRSKKKADSSFSVFADEVKELKSKSKESKGYGYTVKYKTVNMRNFGPQKLPDEICFETEQDFVKFIGKETEAKSFKKDSDFILSHFPELKEWIVKYPQKVIVNHSKWIDLLKVCTYFKSNPRPNLYIRELPIQVHTKYIENNKDVIGDLLDTIIADYININEKKI